MKKIIISLLAVISLTTAKAQDENKVSATIGADIVSRYIWRGQDLGSASLQPTLGISYKGLSLSSWGSVGITDPADTKEVDLAVGYEYKGFSVGITDYWFSQGKYYQYAAHKTTQVFEATASYDFGILSAAWNTNFAGDDGLNGDGKRAYSSYFELSAPFSLGGLDWTGTVGMVPWETSFYDTSGFAVTHVSLRATKDIVIKDKYHLPVFAELATNPRSEKLFLIFGLSFSL